MKGQVQGTPLKKVDSRPSEPKCSHKAKALRDTTTFYGDTKQFTKQWKQHQWRICWDLFVRRFVSTISQKVLLKYSSPKKKSMFPEICSKRKNFHGRKARTSQKKWIIIIIRSHPNTNNHPTLCWNIQQLYLGFVPIFSKQDKKKKLVSSAPKVSVISTPDWLSRGPITWIGPQSTHISPKYSRNANHLSFVTCVCIYQCGQANNNPSPNHLFLGCYI